MNKSTEYKLVHGKLFGDYLVKVRGGDTMNNTFDEALMAWVKRSQDRINAYYTKMGFDKNGMTNTLSVDTNGKKYLRIISTTDGGQRSVFCFIEVATGNVLKAAGWKAPAKHARGNIYQQGQDGVSVHGANYLR